MSHHEAITVATLAVQVQRRQSVDAAKPFWLGIVGAPGSGKSTLARRLADELDLPAIVIPMDGYHFSRRQLDEMPDAAHAHARRGAPFTFDGQRFVDDLSVARAAGAGKFPAFAHGTGDPVENAITLTAEHRVVIVEGNYLLLPSEPWCHAHGVFDETWFVDVSLPVCCERVAARHRAVGRSAEVAQQRVTHNDRPNAELVISACRDRADRRIRLTEDDFPNDAAPVTE